MYVYIGGKTVVPEDEVVAVFDLDNVSTSKRTREFLRKAEEEGMVIPTGDELPQTIVLCSPSGSWQRVYLTSKRSRAFFSL